MNGIHVDDWAVNLLSISGKVQGKYPPYSVAAVSHPSEELPTPPFPVCTSVLLFGKIHRFSSGCSLYQELIEFFHYFRFSFW